MEEKANWKFCVAGNIVKSRTDKNGKTWNGTAAYVGGAKVYLRGKYWDKEHPTIDVIGWTRGKKYKAMDVPVELIENVRFQRVFKPAVLRIMDNWEFCDCWWHTTAQDKREALEFIERWNEYMRERETSQSEQSIISPVCSNSTKVETMPEGVQFACGGEISKSRKRRLIKRIICFFRR